MLFIKQGYNRLEKQRMETMKHGNQRKQGRYTDVKVNVKDKNVTGEKHIPNRQNI